MNRTRSDNEIIAAARVEWAIGPASSVFFLAESDMKKRRFYLLASVSCLGISFCLYVHGWVKENNLVTSAKPHVNISVSQPTPSTGIATPSSTRKGNEAKNEKQGEKTAFRPPDITPIPKIDQPGTHAQPMATASPTPDRPRLVGPPARQLTREQCAERIAASRSRVIYIPPECERQYQESRAEERQAELRRQEVERERRAREAADKRRQQQVDRTVQDIRRAIDSLRKRRL